MNAVERYVMRDKLLGQWFGFGLAVALLVMGGMVVAGSETFWSKVAGAAAALAMALFYGGLAVHIAGDRRLLRATKGWKDESLCLGEFEKAVTKRRNKLEAKLR